MNKKLFKRIISVCLLLSMLALNLESMGFGTFTTAEAATHTHTADCYTGTLHTHSTRGCKKTVIKNATGLPNGNTVAFLLS